MTDIYIYVRLIAKGGPLMTEAQRNASRNYDARNRKKFTLNLNYNTDGDIIRFLDGCENVQGTVKDIIRWYVLIEKPLN